MFWLKTEIFLIEMTGTFQMQHRNTMFSDSVKDSSTYLVLYSMQQLL